MIKVSGQMRTLLVCFFSISFLMFFSSQAFSQPTKITIKQLLESLDHSEVLILDVRAPGDWKASEYKIKGAVRKNPDTFSSWANDLPKNKLLVLY